MIKRLLLCLFLCPMIVCADPLPSQVDLRFVGTGCLVAGVNVGSVAESAGLKSGDIIIEAGGTPVDSVETLQKLIANSSSSFPIQVQRGKESLRLTTQFAPG